MPLDNPQSIDAVVEEKEGQSGASGFMNFSEALQKLKLGVHVAREGWNGKGMWVTLIAPGNAVHKSAAGSFDMWPCFGLKTADNQMQPGWLPSTADLFAEDWEVVRH